MARVLQSCTASSIRCRNSIRHGNGIGLLSGPVSPAAAGVSTRMDDFVASRVGAAGVSTRMDDFAAPAPGMSVPFVPMDDFAGALLGGSDYATVSTRSVSPAIASHSGWVDMLQLGRAKGFPASRSLFCCGAT
jgi:hypothetical protein